MILQFVFPSYQHSYIQLAGFVIYISLICFLQCLQSLINLKHGRAERSIIMSNRDYCVRDILFSLHGSHANQARVTSRMKCKILFPLQVC